MLIDPMRARTLYLQVPRHPLLRMLVIAGAAVLLAGMLAMGVIVGVAVLGVAAGWLLVRRWLGGRRRRRDPSIIEGEFSVVPDRPRDALPPGD
jgi:Flp pilus assembly protein TadB